MAGKKPAKRNVSNAKEVKKELPGKAVYYMGSKGSAGFTCPTCSRSLVKGIIYEMPEASYCCRGCIPKPQEVTV